VHRLLQLFGCLLHQHLLLWLLLLLLLLPPTAQHWAAATAAVACAPADCQHCC
jgi:hypothetical protein